MQNSESVFSALGVHLEDHPRKDEGREMKTTTRLGKLLTKLGIAKKWWFEPYYFIPSETRQKFFAELDKYRDDVKLQDISFHSFMWKFHSSGSLTASEAVFALTALIEAGPYVADDLGARDAYPRIPASGSSNGAYFSEKDGWDLERAKVMLRCEKALGDTETAMIMSKGIELYKKLIEIIMTQATVCIKNLTTDSQVKRRGWVEIDNSTHVTFTKPGPLVRLAYIVTDNVKNSRRILVFVARGASDDRALVSIGHKSAQFEALAIERDLGFKTFDRRVIEMYSKEVENFIRQFRRRSTGHD
ncbi:10626_t:CDS:2 [Paraglomus brasilianum]|uniref:10626_t:CDS:1 n=1 Tax=Paraglomus brasilianum TaxID=144538 RepID=A0A9N9AM70_9GLOM|nr:10626_t:CDS:2 [Paraglomus brasilianum]